MPEQTQTYVLSIHVSRNALLGWESLRVMFLKCGLLVLFVCLWINTMAVIRVGNQSLGGSATLRGAGDGSQIEIMQGKLPPSPFPLCYLWGPESFLVKSML